MAAREARRALGTGHFVLQKLQDLVMGSLQDNSHSLSMVMCAYLSPFSIPLVAPPYRASTVLENGPLFRGLGRCRAFSMPLVCLWVMIMAICI
jgi:hypothetical protein